MMIRRLIVLSLLVLSLPASAQPAAPIIASITPVHVDARARQVAQPTAPEIRLPRATDAAIALTVRNSDNTRTNIADGVIILTVRKTLVDAAPAISRIATITDAASGTATFAIAQSDTSALALGDYLYSIEATWVGGAREQLVKVTALHLVATVGAPSDTPTTPTPAAITGYGLPATGPTTVGKFLKNTDDDPVTFAWAAGAGGGGDVTINTTSPLAGGDTGSAFTLSCPTCVTTGGSYSNPAWITALAASKLTGQVDVARGGTGLSSAGGIANRALYTLDGSTLTIGQLPNGALANSTVTVTPSSPLGGGGTVALGGTLSLNCPECVTTGGSYSDPAWITHLSAVKLTNAPTFDARAYGAVGDGTTDDAPAIQLAFDAACTAGGGTVLLPPTTPSGGPAIYRWKSAVSVNCAPGGIGPYSVLGLGGPGATVLMTATNGSPYVGITVANASEFLVDGIKFYGTMDTANPSTAPETLSGIISGTTIRVRDTEFNGFMIDRPVGSSSLVPDNAIIYGNRLFIDGTKFAACGGSNQALVRVRDYTDLEVRRSSFVDFFTLDTVTMAPAGGDYPYAAIAALSPTASTGADQVSGGSGVTIDTVRFDEGTGGAAEQVVVLNFYPQSRPRIPFVHIRNVQQAVPPSNGTTGIRIEGAVKVDIEEWWMREGGASGSQALYLRNVDEATVRGTGTDPASPRRNIDVDSTVGVLRLIDSHLDPTLSPGSTAVQTLVEKSARPRNLMSFATVDLPTASTVTGAPVFDSTALRLKLSNGSAWKSLAYTDDAAGGDASGSLGALAVNKLKGKALSSTVGTVGAGQDGYCLRWNNASSWYEPSSCPGAGGGATITLTAPAELSVSGSPGDTIGLTWASFSGRKFIGSPSDGTSGALAARALVAADIPALSYAAQGANTDITSLGNLSEQAALVLKPFGASAGNTGEARWLELAAGGTNYVGLKAADALAADVVWTLPSADGSAGQVLKSNGSKVLSWTSDVPGSAASFTGSLVGDVGGTQGATVLASVGSAGSCGGATSSCAVTFDAKGRETARADTAISGLAPSAMTGTAVVQARQVATSTGLLGGGDLSADRTLTLDQAVSPSWSGVHVFLNASSLRVNNGADTFYARLVAAATANRTLTLPDATDTLAGIAASQTLTNKGISGSSNTLSNIGNASLTNSSVTVTAGSGLSGGGAVALGGSVSLANAGVTSLIAGGGVGVSGATGAVTLSTTAGGDATGSLSALTVTKIQNIAVLAGTPSNLDTLCYVTANARWENCASNIDAPGTAGHVLVDSGTAWLSKAVSGDATLSSAGAVAVLKVNGVAVAAPTTKGDIWATAAGPTVNRLAVGTDGQVLTADAASTNGVKWATPGGGSLPDPVTVAHGGTGLTTLTLHGVLIGEGTANVTPLAAAAAGTVLGGVASSDPAFTSTPQLGVAGTTLGTLALAGNTSGVVTIQPQAAAGTYNFNLPTSAGSSGQPLLSAGGGSSPMTFGTLGVAGGGTGLATLTAHAPYVGNGTSAPTSLGVGTNGQLVVGSTGADPAWATLGTGTGISITAGTGTLQVNNTGVTSAVAGTNISVSGATGAVTIGITGQVAVANGGTATTTPGITFGAVPAFLGGLQFFRRAISDAAATVATTDYIVAYSSITATRIATLPNATVGAGVKYWIGDESGSVSTTVKITVKSSGGTIDGVAAGTGIDMVVPRCFAAFESDGTNWHTIDGRTCFSGAVLVAPSVADFTAATHTHQSNAQGGSLDVAALGSGTLGVARGGTGLGTLTAHALYVGNGTSAPAAVSVGATGTLLAGSTGADPAFSATPTVTTLTGSTSLLTPLLDASSAGALNIGTTTATSIALKQNTTLPTAKTLTVGSNVLIGTVADKLRGEMIAFSSGATGDMPYSDTASTQTRLPIGTAGRALVVNPGATAPTWGHVLDLYKSCTSTTTGGALADCDFDPLPSGLGSSNTKSFRGTLTVRLTSNGAGGGTVALTCGTSHGGTDALLSQTLTAGTTTVGTAYGDKGDGSELGTKADSTRNYNLYIDGGSTVSCRLAAPSGTVSSAITVQMFLSGVTM